jgi:hypothetical protein
VDEARNFDTEYLSVADILESAIQSLRKDTNTIIQDNRSFFEKIRRSDITEVYCFGFSFSEVDLPYVNKIVKCLKRSGEAVTWKFNSYSREKNEAYKNVVIQCGFSGTFSEFEASKILIDSDILLPAVLDSFDREETWKFYYDESNFFGKLKMKEDAAGKNVFNVDTDKDFVLAGLVVEPNCEVPDSSQLWKKLHLPCQITELKFTRQFSEGDFLQTIGKSRVYSLLEFIDQSGYFIHVAHINSFYYAVVDIVDSVIELEDIIEYRGDADVDLRYELNNFKSQLYEILHTKRQAVEKLFSDYSYPDIEPECVEDFCNELTLLFGRRNDLSMDMKFLTGMIRKAGSSGELLFLQGNQKRVMIENLTQFYCHFVFLFQKSEHIFDDQKEIRREMERYEFIGSDSKILQNYAFVDSKNDLMIQISDVISGLFGQLFAYLNMTSEYKIRNDVRNMSEAKRKTVALLYKLVMKSEQKNKGFIFSIAPYAVRKKFNLLRG